MDKVNYYEVKILDNKKNIYTVKTENILGENENFIILDTPYYEKFGVDKTWRNCYPSLDKPSIYTRTGETILDNGIFYKFVSRKTRTVKKIRSDIDKYISGKFGFLSNVDLSFIK